MAQNAPERFFEPPVFVTSSSSTSMHVAMGRVQDPGAHRDAARRQHQRCARGRPQAQRDRTPAQRSAQRRNLDDPCLRSNFRPDFGSLTEAIHASPSAALSAVTVEALRTSGAASTRAMKTVEEAVTAERRAVAIRETVKCQKRCSSCCIATQTVMLMA